MSLLKTNQNLIVAGSKTCEVLDLLGEGGQGEVYLVSFEGKRLALKWYFKSFATPEQRAVLNDLILRGAPSERFLWPVALVSTARGGGLGYLMALRGEEFYGIPALLKGRINPTFHALCSAGMQLADAYLQLHSKGLCYRDISLGNAFIEPNRGDILICDNDNVAVNKKGKASILGTPRFIAPEVIRGEALPGTQTDLFSLSVLLFYFYMLHHPFEGKLDSQVHCLDGFAMDELYGRNPVFIFDPNDQSNEPDPRHHRRVMAYWKLYPQFLRDLFVRAFTTGVQDPDARVRESEWRSELARVQDCIILCQNCGAENFFDPAAPAGVYCWNPECGHKVQVPCQLKIENRWVTLNHDRKIVKHHLDGTSYDFTCIVGKVVENPNARGMWGIKNVSNQKWVATFPDGTMRDVEPGKSVAIINGVKVSFGRVEGQIVGQNAAAAGYKQGAAR